MAYLKHWICFLVKEIQRVFLEQTINIVKARKELQKRDNCDMVKFRKQFLLLCQNLPYFLRTKSRKAIFLLLKNAINIYKYLLDVMKWSLDFIRKHVSLEQVILSSKATT